MGGPADGEIVSVHPSCTLVRLPKEEPALSYKSTAHLLSTTRTHDYRRTDMKDETGVIYEYEEPASGNPNPTVNPNRSNILKWRNEADFVRFLRTAAFNRQETDPNPTP